MGNVNIERELVQGTLKICSKLVGDLNTTRQSLQKSYKTLGNGWSDSKYAILGNIVADCTKVLNKVVHDMQICLDGLRKIDSSLAEYDNVNLGGNRPSYNSSVRGDSYVKVGTSTGLQGTTLVDSIIDGLKVIHGKVNGIIPIDDFENIRAQSIQNVNSDTITLGKYRPTVNSDGTLDWTVPGSDSYTVMAGDTTYFSLGSDWNLIKNKYNITDDDMFELFNVPALNDAYKANKEIRFSHDPTAYGDCTLKKEWEYMKSMLGYTRLKKKGDYWHAK